MRLSIKDTRGLGTSWELMGWGGLYCVPFWDLRQMPLHFCCLMEIWGHYLLRYIFLSLTKVSVSFKVMGEVIIFCILSKCKQKSILLCLVIDVVTTNSSICFQMLMGEGSGQNLVLLIQRPAEVQLYLPGLLKGGWERVSLFSVPQNRSDDSAQRKHNSELQWRHFCRL